MTDALLLSLASSNVDRVEFDRYVIHNNLLHDNTLSDLVSRRLQSEYSAVLQRCEGLLSEYVSLHIRVWIANHYLRIGFNPRIM